MHKIFLFSSLPSSILLCGWICFVICYPFICGRLSYFQLMSLTNRLCQDLCVDMFSFSTSKYTSDWKGLGYMACVCLILWSSQSVFQAVIPFFHSHHQWRRVQVAQNLFVCTWYGQSFNSGQSDKWVVSPHLYLICFPLRTSNIYIFSCMFGLLLTFCEMSV